MESAEIAAATLSAGTAMAAGVSAGAMGALGAMALGTTGPAAVAGLTAAAVGAAVAGGVAVDKAAGKDGPEAADNLGQDFYKVTLQEEPFKSTTVRSLLKAYWCAPFASVSKDSSTLTVLVLLSKYRLRNVPVIEPGKPDLVNYITQSEVVQGLQGCQGRDWFDCIAGRPLYDLGLPFMSPDEVISIQRDDLIIEAFKKMKDHKVGGLPAVEGRNKKIIGNISIRDIRYLLLKPELFSNFRKLTVMDFINTVSPETGKINKLITCNIDAPLGDVIHALASQRLQRIYSVNSEGEVTGVITLRDVISCFISEPPYHYDDYFGFAVEELLNR